MCGRAVRRIAKVALWGKRFGLEIWLGGPESQQAFITGLAERRMWALIFDCCFNTMPESALDFGLLDRCLQRFDFTTTTLGIDLNSQVR